MVLRYRRKPTLRPRRKLMKRKPMMRKTSGALTVAKRALRIASQVVNSSTETKYLSWSTVSDVSNNGAGIWGAAIWRDLTDTTGTIPLYNADGLFGNKAFLKYVKGTWQINMNNEEEAVNFTVAVIKFKTDADYVTHNSHVSTIQGQTYFDPRIFKVLYYKNFSMYPGGSLNTDRSGGTCVRTGHFYIPINKMVRLLQEGVAGEQTTSTPLSAQDRYFFVVYTDNSTIDLESPRINCRTVTVYRDNDQNA